jgi:hypothetical protein
MDMVTPLLWIVHRDTIGFLHFIDAVLEEIRLNSTDDYIIQKRLNHWRNLMSRFQTELPAIRVSIEDFFNFLSAFQLLDDAKAFVDHTLDQIDAIIEKCEKSYAALRADMALIESKRAIDQAESVGKLSELGFVFLPVSCVAALFSMQVKPLSKPVSLYVFVTAAVSTVGIILLFRLTIRSTAWIEYKRETSRKIRLHTKIAPGAPIPTRSFVYHILGNRKLRLMILPPLWDPLGQLFLALCIIMILCFL